MGWFKDFVRVANGLTLVAKEAVSGSQRGGVDLKLQSLIKNGFLSVTDLAGITKGSTHQFITRIQKDDLNNVYKQVDGNKESIVFFKNEPQIQENEVENVVFETQIQENEVGNVVFETQIQENVVEPVVIESEIQENEVKPVVIETQIEENDVENVVIGLEDVKDPILNENLQDMGDPPAAMQLPVLANRKRKPRERRVPATPFSRALGFAGLGAGLAWGTLQESAKRLAFGTPDLQNTQPALSPYLSEKNAERLALALCRMRGAALKLGQMLSIQDETLIPAPILAALDIVRQGADVMPKSQLNQVLDAELGANWSSRLTCFDYEPMAAASIGQVHRAVTKDGIEVAMKIQYPGVADSIESDIENLKLLLKYTNLLPEKLYLDNAMKVAKDELTHECNYELEAESQKRFRDLLSDTKGFYVPFVVDNLCSKRVLTSELVPGVPVDKVALLDQETRNYVGTRLLELTLKELFVFRFMQTDPNWSNFLYDEASKSINLIDFGAARDFPKHFVDDYLRMVVACASGDSEAVIEMSKRLGFLTGLESEVMLEAHAQAGFIVGMPFAKSGGYDFRATNITQSISNLGATMLRHRLTPPPEEAYSLHRKLSGAFLACIKIGAVVPCRELLLQVHENYQFSENSSQESSSNRSV
ncbi:hypothetical protein Leryth_005247 [Lithospermum erythrorhizon]|nr:hypothetical protein Leryth_005247 [Lithospermum erythrorhizon]